MPAYRFINYVILIFDAIRDVITLNFAGQLVEHIGKVATTTIIDRLKNDGASQPRETSQLAIPIQVSDLIYFVTSKAVRTTQAPTTTPKFVRTPGSVNKKSSITKPSQVRCSISEKKVSYTCTVRASLQSPARKFLHSPDYLLFMQIRAAGIFLTCLF